MESFRRRFRLAVLAFLGKVVYGLVLKTVRLRFGPDGDEILRVMAGSERVIFAFFHGQLAMMQAPYRGPGLCIQISRSGDGEIIARIVEAFGLRTVRGSASRGGISSQRGLIEAYRSGLDVGIATDGPRGPRHVAKSGALYVAAATGARIFPVAAAPRRRLEFRKSWDWFQVPMPFTRVDVALGEPVRVARDASDETVEAARENLEATLRALTEEAERRARL
jgi:lysophospholipid acyltransferase (LPLAT)-like uncharacterized protein